MILEPATMENVVEEENENFPGNGPVSEFVTDLGIDNRIGDFDDDDNNNNGSDKGKNMIDDDDGTQSGPFS